METVIMGAITLIFEFILSLLPADPFKELISSFEPLPYLNYFNWFFPVGTILKMIYVWITAIAAYYVISVIMRKAGWIS